MTHYEELGVSPDAPAEEIRRAFRRTSRLLHPDLQSAPELRKAAEVQMRRLNEVVEVLCQPESRAAYDRSLSTANADIATPGRGIPTTTPSHTVHPSLIAGLAFGALAMFCWNIVSSAPTIVEPSARVSSAPTKPPVLESATRRVPKRSGASALPPASAGAEPVVVASDPLPRPSLGPEDPPIRESSQPPMPPSPVEHQVSPAAPTSKVSNALDGVWLLFRDPHDKLGPGDFAAEFVELRLHQDGDRFSGIYRSRYRIPDRVSSPDVNFRFEGTIHAQEFTWSGRGGSQGKVRLTLNGVNTIHLDWVAESRIPGSLLTEGSAKLVRLRTD